jgi:hypothetical protein
LGTYTTEIAEELLASQRPLVEDTSAAYLKASELPKHFQETNILEARSREEIARAVSWLVEAYETEARVVTNLTTLLQ